MFHGTWNDAAIGALVSVSTLILLDKNTICNHQTFRLFHLDSLLQIRQKIDKVVSSKLQFGHVVSSPRRLVVGFLGENCRFWVGLGLVWWSGGGRTKFFVCRSSHVLVYWNYVLFGIIGKLILRTAWIWGRISSLMWLAVLIGTLLTDIRKQSNYLPIGDFFSQLTSSYSTPSSVFIKVHPVSWQEIVVNADFCRWNIIYCRLEGSCRRMQISLIWTTNEI